MNTPRNFRPELFEILNMEPQPLSKREFTKIINRFIQTNGWDIVEFTAENPPSDNLKQKYAQYGIVWVENQPVQRRYYSLDNPVMRVLTNITDTDKYIYANDDGVEDDLIDMIYKRFRVV